MAARFGTVAAWQPDGGPRGAPLILGAGLTHLDPADPILLETARSSPSTRTAPRPTASW